MGVLAGKVAIITGAGQGVGEGIATAMAKAGAAVVLAGRTENKVKRVAHDLAQQGYRAAAVRCDVANPQDIDATVVSQFEIQRG